MSKRIEKKKVGNGKGLFGKRFASRREGSSRLSRDCARNCPVLVSVSRSSPSRACSMFAKKPLPVAYFRYLLYLMPVAMVFSYFPMISLGGNETMNFELSVALIWLIVFDVYGFIFVVTQLGRKKLGKIMGKWTWWLAPFFVTLSVFWSLNPLRGVLTLGVMWLLIIAVYIIYLVQRLLDKEFWRVFLRWFFGAAVGACVICLVQCVLDVLDVGQEVTQLCNGCKYQMFGFPRPNGATIEPQFMGNLLLVPSLLALYLGVRERGEKEVGKGKGAKQKSLVGGRCLCWGYVGLAFVLIVTLFLTMSRGAIYALTIGVVGMILWMVFKEKKWTGKSVIGVIGVVVLGFVFALNLQGIFSAVSPTNDGYLDGVGKVVNHLTLGVIDIRGGEGSAEGEVETSGIEDGVVENSVEKSEEKVVENSGGRNVSAEKNAEKTGVEEATEKKPGVEAAFDGYVAESTDTRMRLTGAAMEIWRKDFPVLLFGVGVGGAGQALYNNGLSPAPKEIVQNEYASLLLETGLIGVVLILFSVVMIVRLVLKNQWRGVILASMVALGVSVVFFSGLPNALHGPLFLCMMYFMRKQEPLISRSFAR